MEQKYILEKIRKLVTDANGRIFSITAEPGFPEWMIILPGGHIGFIGLPEEEVPGGTAWWVRELRLVGCAACVIREESQIMDALAYILSDAGTDPSWLAYQRECSRYRKELEKGGGK